MIREIGLYRDLAVVIISSEIVVSTLSIRYDSVSKYTVTKHKIVRDLPNPITYQDLPPVSGLKMFSKVCFVPLISHEVLA